MWGVLDTGRVQLHRQVPAHQGLHGKRGSAVYRCAFCATGAIDVIHDSGNLIPEASNWLANWFRNRGDDLPDVSGRIEYHLSDDETLRGGDSGQTLGLCTRTETKGQPNRYRIDVLIG